MSEPQSSRDKTPQQILMFLGFVLVVGSIFVGWRQSLRQAVNEKLTKIRAEGLPATGAELDKWYVLTPAETNAADLYAEAFRAWKEPTQEQKKWLPLIGSTNFPPVGMPMPEEMRQAIETCLADNADTLRLLHEAAQVNHCRYPVDLSKGMATLLPHLTQLRQSVRLLALQVDYAARTGDTASTAGLIRDGMAVGESLRNEPVLISQLVRIACVGITVSALERALNTSPLQDADLATLEPVLADADKPHAMVRAIIGEQCFGSGIFAHPRDYFGGDWTSVSPPLKALAALYQVSGLKELDQLRYLDLMSEYVAASRLDLPDALTEVGRLNRKTEALPLYSYLSRMLLPSLSTATKKAGTCSARLRLAQAAIAMERYRLAHGQWPEQLVAPVPSDPFDGKPLRYRRTASGIVVWSIGADGRDDGGRESRPGIGEPDITFTVDHLIAK